MPKSLGQIHTLNYNLETTPVAGIGTTKGMLMDISQELSSQLQRNIHQAAYFKCVGVDLVLDSPETGLLTGDKGSCKGRLRYFAPTQGRCEAYRTAFRQMMTQMKQSGINPSMNKQYDFRATLRDIADYQVLNPFFHPLKNLATMNGTDVIALADGPTVGSSIFETHNNGLEPQSGTPTFSSGLTTQIGTVTPQTDFVLQEGLIQSGNPDFASLEMEEIPFVLTWDPENEQAVSLQWRPDPALYIPLMCGQMEIVFDEILADGSPTPPLDGIEVNVAIHIAGWKSILSRPKSRISKKRRTHTNDKRFAGTSMK